MNRDLSDRQYMAAFCAAFVLLVIVAYGVYGIWLAVNP